MEIKEGSTKSRRNGIEQTSIVDFVFDKYLITVFQGSLSKNDFVVQYRKTDDKIGRHCRLRQPSHTQWAVDFLMKIQGSKKLSQSFLRDMNTMWEKCKPLTSNDFKTIKKYIENDEQEIQIETYTKLNKYGEYDVEFLFILMRLLAAQEKTNNPKAYMFGNIITELLSPQIDIYRVLSVAGFRGRK